MGQAGGLGLWDIVRVAIDGTGLTVLTAGTAAYRGAPDWSGQGIVFQEVDPVAGRPSLVIVNEDGANRRVPLTAASTVELDYPRWLPD